MNALEIKQIIKDKGYDDFMTVREVAELFKTTQSHIYTKISRGDIPATSKKLTGKRLILIDDIAYHLATEKLEV